MSDGEKPTTGKRTTNADVWQRLGRVEQDLAGFQGEMRTEVRSIKGSVAELLDVVKGLGARVSRPFNLGWLIAGGALLVASTGALVRMGAAGPLDSLQELKATAVRSHVADLQAAEQRGRHAALLEIERERTADQERQLADLGARLRAVEASRFTAEDARELRLQLRTELRELREDLEDHRKDGHPWRVLERVDGLAHRLELLELRAGE